MRWFISHRGGRERRDEIVGRGGSEQREKGWESRKGGKGRERRYERAGKRDTGRVGPDYCDYNII
jgi:hypothetical protein